MSDTEGKMHQAMVVRDAVEGAGKGMAIGALAGAASRAAKGRGGPGMGAALGATIGAASGGAKSRERILRDIVREQRVDDRWLSRRTARAKTSAFLEELEKYAFMSAIATQIGKKAIGLGTQGAKALGQADRYKGVMQQAAGSRFGGKNLARNVGYGVMGTGAVAGGAIAGSALGGRRE